MVLFAVEISLGHAEALTAFSLTIPPELRSLESSGWNVKVFCWHETSKTSLSLAMMEVLERERLCLARHETSLSDGRREGGK